MKICCLLLAAGLAAGQTTRYPGAVDDDSSLFVVKDNVQTTITAAMGTSDTVAIVSSATGFLPNMVVTICDTSTNTGKCTAWEHMLVTAVSGNQLTVTRAFAGTTARTHSSGRLISALIDSAHQKVLKDSVIAMQIALGPNLGNIASAPVRDASGYAFSAYSCNGSAVCTPGGPSGMSLIVGTNALTMTPVPLGVSGTDTGHALYVSGGTGAAGPCTITGGSGTSGQASGQIIVNCTGTHSGAWTIQSGSGGVQEGVCALPAAGGNVLFTKPTTLQANVGACGKTAVSIQKNASVGSLFTSSNFTILNSLPYPSGGDEIYTGGTGDFAAVSSAATTYTFLPKSGCPVTYPAMNTGMLVARCQPASFDPGVNYAPAAFTVIYDHKSPRGTPYGILSNLNITGLTDTLGGGAVVANVVTDATSTAPALGVSGSMFSNGSSYVIAINGEADQRTAGVATLMGVVGNVGTSSVGSLHTAWSFVGRTNYNAGLNYGGGMNLAAVTGEHAWGLLTQEVSGQFDSSATFYTRNSTRNIVKIWNAKNDGNAGFPSELQFGRQPSFRVGDPDPADFHQVGGIVSDSTVGSPFADGYVALQAATATVMTEYARVSKNGLQLKARAFSALPACAAAVVGSMQHVTDSSTATWGATIAGGGANPVLAYCNGTNWTVAAK